MKTTLALLFLLSGFGFAAGNPFVTTITYSPAVGLGLERGVGRRDPSDVIKVGSTYYLWYTKILTGEQGYPAGYPGTIWYATSQDGRHWKEQGEAVGRGQRGAWDEHGVLTPNILVSNHRYYLFYTGVPEPFSNQFKNATPTAIGVSVADSPRGPWTAFRGNPVLTPERSGRWDDFRVDDSCLIKRDNRYWLYYKGVSHENKWHGLTSMGLAVAASPTGPYTRYSNNPLILPGHEVLVWPFREGVAALVAHGNGIWYGQDGIHFKRRFLSATTPEAPGAYRESPVGAGVAWGICQRRKGDQVFLERFEFHPSLTKGATQTAGYPRMNFVQQAF
ncbi:MAG TPA: family 43 glycosylhydrolase [Terriglobia bacterium]|nr:family 43 glycosylhydrolase [Terriglobia bacterium]